MYFKTVDASEGTAYKLIKIIDSIVEKKKKGNEYGHNNKVDINNQKIDKDKDNQSVNSRVKEMSSLFESM